MAQETTIDWIKREMEKFGERSHLLLDWESFDIIIEEAKAIEKDQRIKDYNAGYDDAQCNHINDAENYVNDSKY
jgi:hypothetical protein